LLTQDRLSLSIHNDKNLVRVSVDFLTNVITGRNAHDHQLAVRSGVNDLPEIVVALGDLLNVRIKKLRILFKVGLFMFHNATPFSQ
jgi:hypothetical protein